MYQEDLNFPHMSQASHNTIPPLTQLCVLSTGSVKKPHRKKCSPLTSFYLSSNVLTTRIITLYAWIGGYLGWRLQGNCTSIYWSEGSIRVKIWLGLFPWDPIVLVHHTRSLQIPASKAIMLEGFRMCLVIWNQNHLSVQHSKGLSLAPLRCAWCQILFIWQGIWGVTWIAMIHY